MSGQQQQQRVRRNASPATTKQGPLKATLPVALMRPSGGSQSSTAPANKKNSPTSSDSPTATIPRFSDGHKLGSNRQSPDQRISPEWKTTASPVSKEKSKPLTSKNNSAQSAFASSISSNSGGSSNSGSSSLSAGPYIRRTGSLDTLYLAATSTSNWPTTATGSSLATSTREASLHSLYGSYCGRLMVDRATQTPEEWDELDRKKSHQRKISDGLEMKYIRQRLQRSTQLSRGSSGGSTGGQQSTSGPSPQPAPSPVTAPPSQILPRFSPIQGIGALSTHHSTSISTTAAVPSPFSAAPLGASSSSPSMYQQPHHFLPGHSGPPLLSQHASVVANSQAGGHSTTHCAPSYNQSAAPIPIPHIPKPLIPRMRSSVEGLNQEIEKLVLRGISGNDAEGQTERAREPTPDGHRAPIAKLFRTTNSKGGISSSATSTVDTQTATTGGHGGGNISSSNERPSYQWSVSVSGASGTGVPDVFLGLTGDGGSGGSSAATSRSQSVSPTLPLIPGSMDNSRPPSLDGRKSASPEDSDPLEDCKFGASPQINKFLAREPPDGCEKIKLVEEPHQICPLVVEPCIGRGSALLNSGGSGSGTGNILLRPSVNFVLMPSQSSAFHPLYKPYLPPTGVSPSSASPSSLTVVDGISGNGSAFLGSLGMNRNSAPTPPTSRSPLNERL